MSLHTRYSRRALIAVGAVIAVGGRGIVAAQKTLDDLPDGPLRTHLLWFLDVLNDADLELTSEDVADHFAQMFLEQVSAEEVIATVDQLRELLGPVTGGRVAKASDEAQAGVQLIGDTGVRVLLTIWIDPATSLIGGMLIQPDTSSDEPEATPAATALASPVVAAPGMDDVLSEYQDVVAALRDQGRAVVEALVTGDDTTFSSLVTSGVHQAMGEEPASGFLARNSTNMLHMEFPEAGVVFDAHVTHTGMSGYFYQLGPGSFELAPAEPQSDVVPSGTWHGHIEAGGGVLEIEVVFSESSDSLEAALSIPSQNLLEHPLTNVRFERERPVGERREERVLPLGQATHNSSYGAGYEWGSSELVINVSINADGLADGVNAVAYAPLPEDPAAGIEVQTSFHLPFEGTWLVIWGGDTEFRNYHASVPVQRHAYDLVVWRDGATYDGDGAQNEHYYAWGQPVFAPAGGTVVEVLDGLTDTAPNAITDPSLAEDMDPVVHPAGNHVVIQTAENEFVLIAHFQQESITVAEGDDVVMGQLLGQCGNSGSSSEPHIHIHLQNRADFFGAETIGLPMAFVDYIADGEVVSSGPLQQGQLVAPTT